MINNTYSENLLRLNYKGPTKSVLVIKFSSYQDLLTIPYVRTLPQQTNINFVCLKLGLC